jgi:WD40 repeat protein
VCALVRYADALTLALVDERTSAHSNAIHSVGFSPDGTKLVSGSWDKSIKLWGGRTANVRFWTRVILPAMSGGC